MPATPSRGGSRRVEGQERAAGGSIVGDGPHREGS